MIYTVTLNPSIDYLLYAGHLTKSATNRAEREAIGFGGKGINVSRVLRELGQDSIALGFIAGFTGQAIADDLRQHGITASLIELPQGYSRINIKLMTDCETEINGQGPEIPPDMFDKLLARLTELEEGDTLVLAGSIPGSLPKTAYAQMLAAVQGKGIRCAVDASGESLMHTLSYRPFLIKPNRQELEEIFSATIDSVHLAGQYGARLTELGAQNVLVSMGRDGAVLIDSGGHCHFKPAVACDTVSTVGAGDSMLAGFLAGYDRTYSAAAALTLGTLCGGATACSSGLADRDTILRLADKICPAAEKQALLLSSSPSTSR